MAKKAEVNKQGVFQGSMIEESGHVRIMEDNVTVTDSKIGTITMTDIIKAEAFYEI